MIVSNIRNELGKAIGSEDAGRFWHSDLSYKREPSLLSALYALEVPVRNGITLGNTAFASSTAAYDALPEDLKRRVQDLKNVHSYRSYRAKNIEAQKEEQARGGRVVQEHVVTEEQLKTVPDIESAVVRIHPVTGRRGLFVNEGHTDHIVGMSRAESDALLKELYSAHRQARVPVRASLAGRRPPHVGQRRRAAQGDVRLRSATAKVDVPDDRPRSRRRLSPR